MSVAYVTLWSLSGPNTTLRGAAILAATLPLWVVLNKLLGLYDRDESVIHKSTLNELPRIAHSVTLGAAALFLYAPLLSGFDIGRVEMVLFWLAAIVLVSLSRQLARAIVRTTFPPENALIIGSGHVARLIARKIGAHPEYGVKVIGFIDPADAEQTPGADVPWLGDLEHLGPICRAYDVERVIVTFSSRRHHEPLLNVVRASKLLDLKITMVPRLFEVMGAGIEVDEVEGMTVLGMRGVGRSRSSLRLKRALDVTASAGALLVLSPLLIGIAAAIKLGAPGPVLFAQRRIGKGSTPFRLWKFRTMVVGADDMKEELAHLNDAPGVLFKISDDPRATRIGRFLRRTSLDELPQLWNVLRGEMSLVGPRPLIPSEDGMVLGRHRRRLDLTPGLTGPWQVYGRTNIPFDEMVELDYLYVADWSLWNDLKLVLRTVPVMARANGA